MNKILLLLVGLCFSWNVRSQITTYVEVQEGGTLLSLLTDREIEQTEKIIISGDYLTEKDFTVLKTMLIQYNLKKIDLEKSYTPYIPKNAFEGCRNLENIQLPKYLINIGYMAFDHCTGLKSIIFPNSLEIIDTGAFWYCSSLEKVYFNRRLDIIKSDSFHGTNLQKIHCKGAIPPACEFSSFDGNIYETCILYVPKGCKRDYMFANGWLNFKNIQEEYVEPAHSLQISLKRGSFIWWLYPSYDGKGGNIVQTIYPDEDCSIEVEENETVCFHITEEQNYFNNWQIDTVRLNGIDITSQVTKDNMLYIDIKQDSKLEVIMTDQKATANENIQITNHSVKTTMNGVQIDTHKLSNIRIYTVNGKLVKSDSLYGMKEYSLSKGIYLVTVDNDSQKVIVK